MQKLYRSCYEMDKRCYDSYGLNEDILMEHAAAGMAHYIRRYFDKDATVLIVAGPGNNGGDGMVLARQLYGDYKVRLVVPFGAKSLMAKVQLERCESVGIELCETLESADVIVDALFGAGLSRPLDEESIGIVERLNVMKGFKIACDIPTGIDTLGNPSPVAFLADATLTMGALKEALYHDAAKGYVGKIERVDLGVSHTLYEIPSHTFLLEPTDFKPPLRTRLDSHKGSYGHAAIFCGEKEGAGIIAAMAASRFGAGLTTLVLHEKTTVPPELMHSFSVPAKATALLVGPGLGNFFERDFLQSSAVESDVPIVLDADAMYSKQLLAILNRQDRQIVLTPHPKEFCEMWQILSGEKLSVEDIQRDRFGIVRRFGERFPHVVLLLKGANMIVVQGERLYVNPLGTPVLAKGGSGDVLSGLIVALLAQGYAPLEAALQSSLALTQAAARYRGASYAMVPSDLIDAVATLKEG